VASFPETWISIITLSPVIATTEPSFEKSKDGSTNCRDGGVKNDTIGESSGVEKPAIHTFMVESSYVERRKISALLFVAVVSPKPVRVELFQRLDRGHLHTSSLSLFTNATSSLPRKAHEKELEGYWLNP
jgi:hypothetical protein